MDICTFLILYLTRKRRIILPVFPHITQKKQSLDANNISFCVGLPKIDYLCSINPINEFIL